MRTSAAAHRVLAGSSLTSTFPIASGWFSPASPSRVYERSNSRGPSTFISQLSFARDPTIFARGLLGGERLGKGKGCDIGYALAGRPREEANSVDARTVTAF